MRLRAPNTAPQLSLADTSGKPITIGGAQGKRTLLCFFRDPACPFCNYRIFMLTAQHAHLASQGLEVVALFAAPPEEVRQFALRYPRPFPIIADPESHAYDAYHVEHSFWAKLRAIATRIPTLLKGLRMVGLAGLNTNNVVPANFLIDADGKIIEAYYGRDAGDHIPFERIEQFAAQALAPPLKAAA